MEIVLILLVVLIVFGVGKLPEVGGAIGKGIREFRKAQRGEYDEEKEESPKHESKSASKPTEDNSR
jgi:sec-independent protein translocase protein TatA